MTSVRFVFAFVVAALGLANSFAQAPKLPEGAVAEKNLAYGEHERQKLDVFVPKGDGPFPLVVWVHGGAWEAGSKDGNPAAVLMDRGFAVASINYRYSKQAVFPAQINDCKAAIRWLRANAKKYKIDADHIGVMGASAGGHLVALLGTSGGVKELEGDPSRPSPAVRCKPFAIGSGRPTSSNCRRRTARKARSHGCSAGRRGRKKTSRSWRIRLRTSRRTPHRF